MVGLILEVTLADAGLSETLVCASTSHSQPGSAPKEFVVLLQVDDI